MITDLYTRDILKLALSLEAERLAAPDRTVFKKSRICGSEVTVDITLSQGRVSAFGAEVKACALGQAATAIVERHIKGQSLSDIRAVRQALESLLAGEEASFPEPWGDLSVFTSAQNHKARHSAILLVFVALEQALSKK